MIAQHCAKSWIIHLKELSGVAVLNVQRGMKGHVIISSKSFAFNVLMPICVLFVGSLPPTCEWLRKHATPLIVHREKVRDALLWLKDNNKHYHDVTVDHENIDTLSESDIVPIHVEHVQTSEQHKSLTSQYDGIDNFPVDTEWMEGIFNKVIVMDIDPNAPAHGLQAVAMKHMKSKQDGFIQIPHGKQPVNEFSKLVLFPLMYPSLFPYGIGGFEDPSHKEKLSLKCHIKHFFALHDMHF
ncbi:uncharacterized protein BJ212DRAFT_1444800 [Suillus subaureus]|uniref:DUF6570 domain-containing protein n=1 Tax=Suillus subaureus TaxID=48587 RepID=A0A9P7ELA6_9AGAM|nr:uncharacterized protein BJ212DRAFT_1444800 [Suillus subaureus]KAG1823855.1 hypothetical protein BJ212DRAFT_1444800 [Suillus subaureus]